MENFQAYLPACVCYFISKSALFQKVKLSHTVMYDHYSFINGLIKNISNYLTPIKILFDNNVFFKIKYIESEHLPTR